MIRLKVWLHRLLHRLRLEPCERVSARRLTGIVVVRCTICGKETWL